MYTPAKNLVSAQNQECDLFVVVLNNLLIHGLEERLKAALDIISHLKTKYNKPVIAMSGYFEDNPQLGEKAKRAGADAFFFLPFDCAEFVATVRRLLGGETVER